MKAPLDLCKQIKDSGTCLLNDFMKKQSALCCSSLQKAVNPTKEASQILDPLPLQSKDEIHYICLK